MENWMRTHPKVRQLNSYVNGDRPQLLSTLQTYLDLTEDILYSEQLNMAFLSAQQSQEGACQCILPLPAGFTLTMERFSEFFIALKDHIPCCHGDQSQVQLTISLVDSDSTVVYYQMTDGIK